jgi:16S rRNA G966 N2-methylase RsmD
MSISLEITPEQIEWFSCTNIVHEFEIRFRLGDPFKQGSYITGVEEKLWKGIISLFSNDPSFSITKETYTNENFTMDVEKRRSSPIRKRIVTRGESLYESYITKKTVSEHDIPFIGFELRISEAEESALRPEEVPSMFKSYERVINRTTFTKSFPSGNQVKMDCSSIRNTVFTYDPVSKRCIPDRQSPRFTWEVEIEMKVARSNTNFFTELLPILEQVVIALHEHRLPTNSIVMQRSTVFPYLANLESSMKTRFDSNLRGLAYNIKERNLQNLSSYAMTNKLDGERKFILVLPKYVFIMNSGGVRDNSLEHFISIPHSLQDVAYMLIDVEYEHGVYHAFDLIFYQFEGKTLLPVDRVSHQERMSLIRPEHVALPFQIKRFYYGSIVENMNALMRDHVDPILFFTQNDGIIFTPKESSYLDTHKSNPHLKFKFSSKLSVDFLIDQTAPTIFPFRYHLYSNHRQKKDLFDKIKEEKQLRQQLQQTRQQHIQKQLLQVQEDIQTRQKDVYELHSLVPLRPFSIVECILVNGRWIMLRERPDRDQGNRLDVIKDVMEDMRRPLSITQLYARNPIPQSALLYLSVLENKNQSYLYDTFFNKLISLSYLILTDPAYKIDHFIKVFYVFLQKNTDQDNILTKIKSIQKSLTDSEILDALISNNETISYYQYEELDVFYKIYDSLFKEPRAVRSIFDVKQYGKLSDLVCIPSRHILPIHKTTPSPALQMITEDMISSFKEIHFGPDVNPLPTTKEEELSYQKYARFFIVPSSHYSVLKPWHESQVKAILTKWFSGSVKQIVDGTAHIGVDSIHLSDQFPHAKVDSFELVPDTLIALRKNVQMCKKEKVIRVHFQDVTTWVPTQQVDILYLDPPWGGESYKENKSLNLYLQKEGEPHDGSKHINVLIDRWMKTGLISSIVLKSPQNGAMSYLKRNYHVEQETVYNRGKKIAYYLFKIEMSDSLLHKPKSKLTLWSVPYYTSLDSIFFNTDAVLVTIPDHRYPTLLLHSTLQQYTYQPMSYDRPIFIDQTVITKYALDHSFEIVYPQELGIPVDPYRPEIITISYNSYILFRKKNVQPLDEESSLKDMRKYHNIEKKSLIQKYAKKKSVLDLGAGFGGDLFKYEEAGVTRLIAVEPSETNLLVLLDRLQSTEIKQHTTTVKCLGQEWNKIKPHVSQRVQVVSSFFSMTFLFESITLLRSFLHTVDQSLEEGGFFIGTMMSGEKTYQLLEKVPFGKSLSIGPDVTFTKQYKNQSHQAGMKLHMDIRNTIVGSQDEYLAFFTILEAECKALGLQLVQTFDFKPPEKFHLQPYEVDFSVLNIGFAFQKLPERFAYPTELIKPDETFQFINLYKEEQLLIRTGVDSDFSFYRSYLFNLTQEYRLHKEKDVLLRQRIDMVHGLFDGFRQRMASQKEITEEMNLDDLPMFMSSQQINIYVVDSVTRRPIHMEGYDVSRTKSMMMVYHRDQHRFEPLACNIKGTAKRIFGVLDPHIVCVHRSMKKLK